MGPGTLRAKYSAEHDDRVGPANFVFLPDQPLGGLVQIAFDVAVIGALGVLAGRGSS